MPDLPPLTAAIAQNPDDRGRWLALASWLADNRRDDEAVAVRTLWPVLRDNLAAASLESTLEDLARNARLLAGVAREVEWRADQQVREE
jgi:uncharacterized protein (TIGR02996 family)